MSIERNISNSKNVDHNNEEDEGRVVIDAVHERFRQSYIHCDDCNTDVIWDHTAIKRHYNSLHPSNRYCRYCKGKVFMYRKIIPVDSDETSQELSQGIVYHKCEHNEQTKADE